MSAQPKILIVDDDQKVCQSLKALLSLQDHASVTCDSVEQARQYLGNGNFELVLLDILLGDESGFSVMDFVMNQGLEAMVIIMTGKASVDSAVQALRKGAYDYLKKPFSPDEMLATVNNALHQKELAKENQQLNKQLQLTQRLEALGTLTGGIAHDFNNILAIILGYTEIAQVRLEDASPVQKNLAEIKSATLRARDIVSQLLTFSRKEPREKEVLDIRPIIKEGLKMLRSTIPTSIEFQGVFPEKLPNVLMDGTQIHQVLVNLCNNAAYAMEGEGTLEVRLDQVSLDREEVSFDQSLEPGHFVRLSVRDTGHGIPAEDFQRIFDPYFSTKDVGKGTGLGLSVVLGIVKSHGGGIRVQSEAGTGTAFEIYLPASAEKHRTSEPEPSQDMPTGSERILVVDDEEPIVKLNQKRLQRLGYAVTCSTDPLQALEIIKSNPDQFDLVITDTTMPGITGDKLSKEILDIRSDMHIILCTGHSDRISEDSAKDIGLANYLEKPLDMQTLSTSLREVLDRQ